VDNKPALGEVSIFGDSDTNRQLSVLLEKEKKNIGTRCLLDMDTCKRNQLGFRYSAKLFEVNAQQFLSHVFR